MRSKRFLSVLTAVVMLFSLLPLTAAAEDPLEVDININDNTSLNIGLELPDNSNTVSFYASPPDGGTVNIFGLELAAHEREIKRRIGYAGGAADFYRRKPLGKIVAVTKHFYDNWDDAAYRKYLNAFSLDENKTPMELS